MTRLRLLVASLIAVLASALGPTLREVLAALGGRPDHSGRPNSVHFRDGVFRNSAPPRPVSLNDRREFVRDWSRNRRHRRPGRVPLVSTSGLEASAELHVTWYGHSSALVEIDGVRVLLDPMWSDRASPSRIVGPKRLHPVPQRLEELPAVDAIVISHDHYDHLDMPTVRTLRHSQAAPFVVPVGVGAHMRSWGVPGERIVELDWHEDVMIGDARIVATPAQHFSGRAWSRNNTLWASWVIVGPRHRVFYSGDTGYFPGFRAIGEQYGPFHATLIQIGAYALAWPDMHMTPEEGITAHRDVRGDLLIPVHWATFNLAPHPWSEPADRLWDAALAHGVPLAVPRPGERIAVAAAPQVREWWRETSPGVATITHE